MSDLLESLLSRLDSTSAGTSSLIVLASALLPLLAAAAVWTWRMPDRVVAGGVALAVTWNGIGLLGLNSIAVHLGWWSFGNAGPKVDTVPIVLWFGWTLLWGVVAALSPWRIGTTMVALAAFDLCFMPLMGDVVHLGPWWLIGELVALTLVAWPGLLLMRWSVEGTHLAERVRLQLAIFSLTLLWAIPLLTITNVGRTLHLDVPTWAFGAVLFGVGGASLPALTAVNDFYLNGASPWPWDSTDRPVRSGPYRYLRAPMQSSAMLVLVTMAFLYGEPLVALAAASCNLYCILFCRVEARELQDRFGVDWTEMAMSQRRWLPSWRPASGGEHATVWVNLGCDVCAPIASFLEHRNPVNLTIRNAAEHPGSYESLRRLRYERADGAQFDGVAAVGATLEHIHLGWAMIGWTLRLPVLWRLWQLIGDAVGFEARLAQPADQQHQLPLDLPHR